MSFRSVGAATAAFAIAVLEGSTQPGVWFPEEDCTKNHLDIKKIHLYFLNLVCSSLTARGNRNWGEGSSSQMCCTRNNQFCNEQIKWILIQKFNFSTYLYFFYSSWNIFLTNVFLFLSSLSKGRHGWLRQTLKSLDWEYMYESAEIEVKL